MALITSAYVQGPGSGRLGPEERDLIEGLGFWPLAEGRRKTAGLGRHGGDGGKARSLR